MSPNVLLAAVILSAAPPPLRLDAEGEPLPMHALTRLGTTRFRHGPSAEGVALSPNLRWSATAGGPLGEIILWDNRTGRPVGRTTFTPNIGPSLFEVTDDGTVFAMMFHHQNYLVWNARANSRRMIPSPVGVASARALTADGRTLFLAVGRDVAVIDAHTGRERVRLRKAGAEDVRAVAVDATGNRLAVVYDRTPTVWDVAARKVVAEASGYTFTHVVGQELNFIGERLFWSSILDVEVFNVRTGKGGRLQTLSRIVLGVGPGARPDRLTVAGRSGGLWRFDLEGNTVTPVAADHHYHTTAVAIRPEMTAFVTAGRLRLVDNRTGKPAPADASFGWLGQVRVTGPGEIVAVGQDARVTAWDARTGRVTRAVVLGDSAERLPRPTLDGTGRRAAVVYPYAGHRMTLYDATSGRVTGELSWPKKDDAGRGPDGREMTHHTPELLFSPDGSRFAIDRTGDDKIAFEIRDGASGKPLPVQPLADVTGRLSSWSPDGRLLVTEEREHFRVWETASGRLRRTIPVHFASRSAFRPDGKVLALGTFAGIRLVPLHGGKEVIVPARGFAMAFSPDGRLFAAESDNVVGLWKSDGTPVATFRGHALHVSSLAFSPDGNTLVSGSQDGTCLVWRVPRDGEPQGPLSDTTIPPYDRLAGDDIDATMVALIRAGDAAMPTLAAALTDADTARAARAVEVLERIGSPRAVSLLTKIAGVAKGRPAREAAEALSRLRRFP